MKKEDIFKLIISVALPLLAGFIGSYFTTPGVTGWYAELSKPALNPPSWVFAPAWTTLYLLMGVALFLVWRKKKEGKNIRAAIGMFGVQLFLNGTWSFVFFGMENPQMALVNIVLLWLAIVFTIYLFYKISRPASYLLFPYLLWTGFAAYLNYMILILN